MQDYGYDEINLNVGCPSHRVVSKADAAECFGARLMLDPPHVGVSPAHRRRVAEARPIPRGGHDLARPPPQPVARRSQSA